GLPSDPAPASAAADPTAADKKKEGDGKGG
ncbi:MAG: hypothetical protein JWQ51_3356, partial [Tardiphaga sp.]|nr:hypothetical protein [Tardiphaga sp.]